MESTLGAYRDRVINGPVGKTLLWLGLPLMAVQLVHVSYNIADAYWLSRYSEYAYAAPRQIWPFFMFLNAIAMGISTANTALISQAIGAKDYEYAKRVISYFITLNVLLNAAAATLFYLLRPWMFRYLINVPPEIYSYVMVYSAIVTFDLFIAAFTISYSSIFQSIGDTRTPSRIGVITAMMNIVLDPLMIFGVRIRNVEIIPSMGVAGAALATVLSRLTGLVLLLRVIR
ncbi:MAG: MATE family efflux transporter, partial [Desulfurococcaceae archaeon]